MFVRMPGFHAESSLRPSRTLYALSINTANQLAIDGVIPENDPGVPWWWWGRFVCIGDRYGYYCYWVSD